MRPAGESFQTRHRELCCTLCICELDRHFVSHHPEHRSGWILEPIAASFLISSRVGCLPPLLAANAFSQSFSSCLNDVSCSPKLDAIAIAIRRLQQHGVPLPFHGGYNAISSHALHFTRRVSGQPRLPYRNVHDNDNTSCMGVWTMSLFV